jgi:hypothetical protein
MPATAACLDSAEPSVGRRMRLNIAGPLLESGRQGENMAPLRLGGSPTV